MKVVIQCGGKGTRLKPYTMILPKPLMPVGSRPVLELLLKWLRRNGTQEIYITTGYLGHLIRTVCGDGQQWDMRINYTEEKEPLGTIGPLSLIRDCLDSTFLVINGDVLTDLSLNAFVACHRRHNGALTVATMTRTIKIMEPEVLDHIPSGVPFGFDDLALCMLDRGLPIGTFRHNGMWLDVGRVEDFQKAQELNWDDQPPAFEIVAAA